MLDFLAGIWDAVIGFLGSVLPNSPFRDLTLGDSVGTAMGWLNWCVPIGAMCALFGVWLAAFAVYCVVRFVKGHSIDLVAKFSVTE